ncbi:MAG: [FeFe] hydrogenase H-cluster radical SAM maturase HydE [Chitinispirillia bacterium]|nr:[FeFe] hydrogenase H-cluster radical SAM maturase HydE [Chitinispirillia bacterium]MCL2242791.1 [FeFe] hydrogenase H-cluster radical SAM maturase HydE [Chitinispirillia bacterium]
METTIAEILQKGNLGRDDIITLLGADESADIELIRSTAEKLLLDKCGPAVFYRGLIEFSNLCIRDCLYCGIRKSNAGINRYTLSKEEIVASAKWCADKGYGSVVLQSGERQDDAFIDFLVDVISEIKSSTASEKMPGGAGVTLSVGEQSPAAYKRLYEAGAHRYLLRIESSNPILFASIHPPEQELQRRIDCLKTLRETGFQVGTGVMIGIPGQTVEVLADDILFFKEMDIDMIGMGPYIVHSATPMSIYADYHKFTRNEIFQTALLMISVCRIVLGDVNIASTTALQAMRDDGREEGLRYGANVIMPLTTPLNVRQDYLLYDGKPCLDEDVQQCSACLEKRIRSIGREIAVDVWGDSKKALRRQN